MVLTKGYSKRVKVTERTKVLEVKEELSKLINIPVSQQKLLLTGRPLTDEKLISEYSSIKEGTKLNLIAKQEVFTKPVNKTNKSSEQDLSILREAAYKFLRDFYTESETQKIVEEFGKEFSRSVSTLSLDDYERIAISCLDEEKTN